FRLEMDGVLKSWAVPKGIPFVKAEKHLAVQVEDHPVSYINFEGIIPKGQYGGGTVMVWDRGTFSTSGKSPLQELEAGKLHFTLDGKKLRGDWHLVRLRRGTEWLLIKGSEGGKPISKKSDDTSALSGKTMRQLSESNNVWNSKPDRQKTPPATKAARQPLKTRSSSVAFIEPMKARVLDSPPALGDWIYEIKFDGYRALALKDSSGARLFSRNEKDFSEKFPAIADAAASLEADDVIIDGEIVALDARGVSSFQLLQAFETGSKPPPLFYYAFDLLQLNGNDLRGQPLSERKAQLEQLLKNAPAAIRFSASLGNNAGKLLKQAEKLGLEGLIGKRKNSLYEAGKRSGAWIKLKLRREQEFVIGGYTNPEGARTNFGALLVGFYENEKLKFCGKVGTGFNTKLLNNLHSQFKKISSDTCPFVNLPETRGSRYSPRITLTEMRKCHWVKPEMVCQICFSEWTRDDKLRQPAFLGLREDKNAKEVIREKAE
ncbi:MAG TPA: non-homologous end-joining DNA ligase, partial [Pseudomonadales bacterium]|nr:non-homologous end-joining DNA ligase [Pseudomonadales bacterium]